MEVLTMNKFKELRISKGMTQEEFRQKFNSQFSKTYTPAAISQIENGKRMPEISALMNFADFYEVSLDYLLGREEKNNQPMLTAEQTTILLHWSELNSENQKEFLNFLDYLCQKQDKKGVSAKSSISPIIQRRPQKIKQELHF